MSTPNTSAYPLMTHCALVSEVERSRSISGMATLSAVKSLAMTNTPNAIATSASQVSRSTWSVSAMGWVRRP
jgi:hypothetical protein